jgi:hypothetical protein
VARKPREERCERPRKMDVGHGQSMVATSTDQTGGR